jgi:uncharacterized protein
MPTGTIARSARLDAALDIDVLTERLSRKLVLRVSLGSLVAFAVLAWLITYADGRTIASLFRTDRPLSEALAVGLVTGTLVSLGVTAAVLRAPALVRFREFLRGAYSKLRLHRGDMLIVALNAGVGEELLFRGAIHPLLGNGWTSLVFALLHTGIPRSRLLAAFGLYVFAVSLGLGVLYEHYGLAAAMAAHAVYDLVFLVWSAHALTDQRLTHGRSITTAVDAAAPGLRPGGQEGEDPSVRG